MTVEPARARSQSKTRIAHFNVESRLLEELGERLVSNSQVALVELIKNSYDADASSCQVRWDDNEIVVEDDGHGMSPDDFLNYWMTIATNDKKGRIYSRKYARKMSGEKGVGRFAARFLGGYLELRTVSSQRGKGRTRLVAVFDWDDLDKSSDLNDLEVRYTVEMGVAERSGTKLTIRRLRDFIDRKSLKAVRTNVLGLTSPFSALDGTRRVRSKSDGGTAKRAKDPGFSVQIGDVDDGEDESNLAKSVLDNYVGRVQLKVSSNRIRVTLHFQNGDKHFSEVIRFPSKIGCEVTADIRYFPRRSGTFSGAEVDGRRAWSWVREYGGVAVIDHGFRVPPYGAGEDDWLHLDADTVQRRRDWRTDLMKRLYPIPDEIRQLPGLNPALWLPRNLTLVGAVFIESSGSRSSTGLVPNMDRQGYLENHAFNELKQAVRFSLELLGYFDRQLAHEEERRLAISNRRKARQELRVAIDEIRAAPNLNKDQKNRIINQYSQLYENVEELEQYDRSVRQNLDVMSSLGVIAGFMTHECQRMLFELRQTLRVLAPLAKRDAKIRTSMEKLVRSEDSFRAYTQFTQLFLGEGMQLPKKAFKAKYQIKQVVGTFEGIQNERGIDVEVEVEERTVAPIVPIAMYSGITLNLHTNALKAVIQLPAKVPKKIAIRAWNDDKSHFLEVLDSGVGVPDRVRERIFDPLYTTTSSLDSPLGSGMGLGLALVKRLVESADGRIQLVDAPDEYSTCFRVQIPLRSEALAG